jgi:ubiquitin-like 1-activating enzyme E1 B
MWSLKECFLAFQRSVDTLHLRMKESGDLVWDKDDDSAMDFVTACANIRAAVFGIGRKTRFDVKSMAGNIIPAIATTNAIVAGAIVIEAFKIVSKKLDQCKGVCMTILNILSLWLFGLVFSFQVILMKNPTPVNRLLIASCLNKPNTNCPVCSPKPEVSLKLLM